MLLGSVYVSGRNVSLLLCLVQIDVMHLCFKTLRVRDTK